MVLREGRVPRSGATEEVAPSETCAVLPPASECRAHDLSVAPLRAFQGDWASRWDRWPAPR